MSLILGLGSPHGDDQLGWIAVDRLRPRLPTGISAHKVQGGLELLECLEGQDAAVVIDAAAPAGRPGTIRSFAWPCPELTEWTPWSTHGLGLVQAFHLAEVLGRLPRRVTLYTVEAQATAPGAPLSLQVSQPLNTVVATILRDVTAHTSRSAREEGPCTKPP
jgi:hydrogenase maturation protease